MSLFKEWNDLKKEFNRKESEILDKIVFTELDLTNQQLEVYKRRNKGESIWEVSENLNISKRDVELTIRRTNERFKKWVENHS